MRALRFRCTLKGLLFTGSESGVKRGGVLSIGFRPSASVAHSLLCHQEIRSRVSWFRFMVTISNTELHNVNPQTWFSFGHSSRSTTAQDVRSPTIFEAKATAERIQLLAASHGSCPKKLDKSTLADGWFLNYRSATLTEPKGIPRSQRIETRQ